MSVREYAEDQRRENIRLRHEVARMRGVLRETPVSAGMLGPETEYRIMLRGADKPTVEDMNRILAGLRLTMEFLQDEPPADGEA